MKQKKQNFPYFFDSDLLLRDALHLKKNKYSKDKKSEIRDKLKSDYQKYLGHAPTLKPLVQTLPVSAYEDRIKNELSDNQVCIIQGATGSGKSTQIPKILMNIGLSHYGLIGMTQPRRLAAEVLTKRIREETLDHSGSLIGWQVRHQKHLGSYNRIKVMTDGILLQEAIKDKYLANYQAIIIDEVHERSLNTDLLLGLIKKTLIHRPDLKVLLLSATLDHQALSKFFLDAPVIKIPGKTHPIEDYYLPEELSSTDYWQRVYWAVEQIRVGSGDTLFFLPTEYHIFAHKKKLEKIYPEFDFLPLFSRLPQKQQQQLFEPSKRRRIILSTNIAETSITLPSITAVIDEGTGKIDSFDPILKMVSFPIVPVSQSQVMQRRGRCGRTGPGRCYYLYTIEDFDSRDEMALSAIKRASTDQLVLQLLSMGKNTLETFPFFEKPENKNIKESLSVLKILNLCDQDNCLTSLGKKVRYLPLEPRLAIILEKAKEHHCFLQVSIIVAFFMGEDPKVVPREQKDKAQAKHLKFADQRSDFISILNLFYAIGDKKNNALKKFAQEHFLSVISIVFWKKNLQSLLRTYKYDVYSLSLQQIEDSFHQVHRALSWGLIDKIFYKDKENYVGPRGVKPFIDTRSTVKPSSIHQWVMAFSLEKRMKTFINYIGPVETHFVEKLVESQLKIIKKPPYLCLKTGQVYQSEDRLIWGLPLSSGKRKLLSRSDLAFAREVFIKEIFANDLWLERVPQFYLHYKEALRLSIAARESQILLDGAEIASIALKTWPKEICSFDTLQLYSSLILQPGVTAFLRYRPSWHINDFPNQVDFYEHLIDISYTLDKREAYDGYTLLVPKELFYSYSASSWLTLISGYRRKVIEALIDLLPKKIKNSIEDKDEVVEYLTQSYQAPERFDLWLVEQMHDFADQALTYHDFSFNKIPEELLPYIVLEDNSGNIEELGKISFSSSLQKAEKSHLTVEDVFLQVNRSARSGAFYLPNSDLKELTYFGDNAHSWMVHYRSSLLSMVYSYLSLQQRKIFCDISKSYSTAKPVLLHLMGRYIDVDPFEIIDADDIEFYAQDLVETTWSALCCDLSDYEYLCKKWKAYSNKTLPKYQSIYLELAALSLQDPIFCSGLPPIFFSRISQWIDLVEEMRTKQFEKENLLKSHDSQFKQFLKELKLSDPVPLNSIVLAVYLEWSIAIFLQPEKPIKALSLKKALQWARQTQNFISWT